MNAGAVRTLRHRARSIGSGATLAYLFAYFAAYAGSTMASDADRGAHQAELDAKCEAARESKLAPERQAFVEECVAKHQRENKAACVRFYADYGAATGNRPPLYYDLPACERAFEYRQGYRQAG